MSKFELTDWDFCQAAKKLKCTVADVKTVNEVESAGAAFYPDGFPTILFERHKFYKNARRDKRDQWHREFPTICNPSTTPRGGYGSKAVQRQKFSQAFALDPDAAMMACSWGAFQELGENYDDYGFDSVGQFVEQMRSGAAGQLDIFCRSILKRGIADELRNHQWALFARNYNGAGYKKFDYDTKLANAHRKHSRNPIDCTDVVKPKDSVVPQLSSNTSSELTSATENSNTSNGATDKPLLKYGSTGDAVRELQTLLGGIAVDGAFGSKTLNAVIEFQQKRGLEDDGKVGPDTWAALETIEPTGLAGSPGYVENPNNQVGEDVPVGATTTEVIGGDVKADTSGEGTQTVKTATDGETVKTEQTSFNPQTIPQYIPKITEAKTWLGTLTGGSFISVWVAQFAGLPDWAKVLFGVILGIGALGLILVIWKHRGDVVGIVNKVIGINADPTQNNIQLFGDKERYRTAVDAPPTV